jgi:hypothetical protein
MASVKLTLETIAGGKLAEAFDDALNRVNGSFEDKDLDGAEREITIKIKLRKEGEGFVKTVHAVETKLPVRKVTGMAWQKEEGLFTESLCIDDRQMNLSVDNVTPIGKGKTR